MCDVTDMVGGWLCSLLGGFRGRKLYILGVAGYNKPIWDILALKGEWEEAAEPLQGAKLINFFPIRQAVPDGLARASFYSWAHWARFFVAKNIVYW